MKGPGDSESGSGSSDSPNRADQVGIVSSTIDADLTSARPLSKAISSERSLSGNGGDATSSFPPQHFDEYHLVRALGRGAMGIVYLAIDTLLDRPVAIKFAARPDLARSEQFIVEARAMARFQHPNIATIYRVGELASRPYIVSEFIDGQSLDALDKPIPWRRAAEIGRDLARGLAAAHRRGVLHRDIKPANAMVTETGEAKLLDFGLATLLDMADPASHLADGGAMPLSGESDEERPPALSPALIRHGAIVGTPNYIAPEVWRRGAATERSDVYSFGVLLYELCAGFLPHLVPYTQLSRVVNECDAPALSSVAPDTDERLVAIVARCLARDLDQRYPSGEAVRDALEDVLATGQSITLPPGNPYRGLLPFHAEHRPLFFGRDAETREVIERLRSDPLVIIAGESGVGKSSLVRASVMPVVTEGALGDDRAWKTCHMLPGKCPLVELTALVAERLGISDEELARALDHDVMAASRLFREKHGQSEGTVILIDQLEELVTLSEPEQAAAASEVLGCLAERIPGLRLLATVRGDHFARLAHLPGLSGLVERSLYILRPLGEEAIRQSIVGPARARGVKFESDALVDKLVRSTLRAEGGLPLLQFALAELWNKRDPAGKVIPDAALEQIGGVEGALSRHADLVIASMLPETRQYARRILVRLVTLHGTRARRTADELPGDGEARDAALDKLVQARLVVAGQSDGKPVYEIAHEALIRDWAELRRWLDREGDNRAVKERLASATTEWIRVGRSGHSLWRGRQLREAAEIDSGELAEAESAFLLASRRAAKHLRWRRRLAPLVVFLAIGVVYGVVRYKEIRDEERRQQAIARQVNADVAEAELHLSHARKQNQTFENARDKAFAAYVRGDQKSGDALWEPAAAEAVRIASAYARAGRSLERALQRDAARLDVRGLFAEVLFERALLADRERRMVARDEFLERLKVYDDTGKLMKRWRGSTSVSVTTSLPGKEITLYRYDALPDGTLQQRQLGQPDATPISWKLEPGSYLLVVSATDDTVQVRYPFLIPRSSQPAQPMHLHIDLPARSEVPMGFEYVPAGWFLFGHGSRAEDEPFRRWYETLPAHPRHTEAYLIAKYETTYADWLEFLRALPAQERVDLLPNANAGVHGISVALRMLERDEFELLIRPAPGTIEYRAKTTVPIEYQPREKRRVQDWLRFPVTGVSGDNARAYLAWLDRSGRVAGARLCREDEWERAARGADERPFPHGNRVRPDDANFDETYGDPAYGPDEIGSHPASQSPFGLQDMMGNALEMVESILDEGNIVLRSGSYLQGDRTGRSTNRGQFASDQRHPLVGVRICAPAPTR
ncbi:MAG: protein kinase [Proteobacteria bacterium]|nr:protein kinase [Pseudomonadota bacterium]